MMLRHARHTQQTELHLKQKVLPLLLFGPMLVSLTFLGLRSSIFSITSLECVLDTAPCPDYITAELEKMLGSSFFFTDFDKKTAQLIEKAPFLTTPKIKKTLPGNIHFSFRSAQQSYLLQYPLGQIWIIDDAGFVTATATAPVENESSVITLAPEYPLRLQLRERVEPSLHNSLKNLTTTLEILRLPLTKLTLLSPLELQATDESTHTILLSSSDAPTQLRTLAYLYKHFSFSTLPEPISQIDLRYGHVILRTEAAVASAAATLAPPALSSPTASVSGSPAPLR